MSATTMATKFLFLAGGSQSFVLALGCALPRADETALILLFGYHILLLARPLFVL
jgi:hypothetical protein